MAIKPSSNSQIWALREETYHLMVALNGSLVKIIRILKNLYQIHFFSTMARLKDTKALICTVQSVKKNTISDLMRVGQEPAW